MSLRFYFGPSGAGKSRLLYEEIITRAMENPRQNFLILVPDQFTMQTQKDLVTLHKRGGIMNIDVLSFGRLSHRIMEEVGGGDKPVLDDTGKSLVLQKVASSLKDRLPCLGSHLHKQGYISEVKSAISEFMQYGISVRDVTKLISFAEKRGALVHKLKDLQTLYQGFMDYIGGEFVTTEETLDVLCRSLPKSRILRGSVAVFDGFTGFTPIQNRLIQELMTLVSETVVTVTMGASENPYAMEGEQQLFHLSKKTVYSLNKLASEASVERGTDLFIVPYKPAKVIPGLQIQVNDRHRFVQNPAMMKLEQELFRYPSVPFQEEQDNIHVFEASAPGEEVHQAGQKILELIRTKAYAYRDFALIVGDMESYAPFVEKEFMQMGIPVYIDRTRGIILNPMIEYIKSALSLYLKDFSYEAVFHYLRSGLADVTGREADILENYVIQTGIRGKRRWSRIFTHKTKEMGEREDILADLNEIRERIMSQVQVLSGSREKVCVFVERLYDFLVKNRVQQKLEEMSEMFDRHNDPARSREYAQIYRLVMDLLNQIHQLLGQEEISLQEFSDICEAGFGEIEVGTIPQNVDRVLAGDMERTRLKQVKVLFFLGVNDGNIPKSAAKGGLISDMDREFLQESELELAPSPRQQMYIQRLYLYLNMTKPSDDLYLSYSRINAQGKSIRPSYLIDVIRKMFPLLVTEHPENRSVLDQVATPVQGLKYLAEGLRCFVEGSAFPEGGGESFFTLYHAYGENNELRRIREGLTKAAFTRYQETGLSKAVARALYGLTLENSVSRLETFAACAYRHFLQYGLSLKEREEFGFELSDMGNVFHGVLESFSRKLDESGHTWFDFTESFAASSVKEALEAFAASYGDTILYSSARNEYAVSRMGRVLNRTVLTLQSQLKKGDFKPDGYELSFHYAQELEAVNVTLSEEEKMYLKGRIDRIDIAEHEDMIYVKVIDYKSGNRQFDLAALYYGLQLQLVVYLNAAMEVEAKKHPGKRIVPGAFLYYHIEDPTVESPVELSEEEINKQLQARLRMNGVVNESQEVVSRLDRTFGDKSDVIPVERKKDGSFSARSSVMNGEELGVVSRYVNEKIREIGQSILQGKIGLNPYEKGTSKACQYCEFRKVCGFDPGIPGCEVRVLPDLTREELLKEMGRAKEESADGNGIHT